MGLFGIRFRRSYDDTTSRVSSVGSGPRPRSHDIRSGRSDNDVAIHIGEPEPFRLNIENLLSTVVLSRTSCSVCIRVSYNNSKDDEVVVAKWNKTSPPVNSKDHIAVLIACDIIEVPRYRIKEVFRHYGKFISVGIRTYIRGQTLKSVYSSLTEDEVDAVFMQVQATVWLLAKKTSRHFGHINDGVFRTSSPTAYLRVRTFFDKASKILNETDWVEQGSDSYTSVATLCHGDLSPEHIIVDGTTVVGIVGWTKADFMPEAYERLMYYFRSNPKDSQCWFRKMADVTTCPETERPSVEFVFNVTSYAYKRTWNVADENRKAVIDKLWRALITNYTQLNCLSMATEMDCDNMSLSSLGNWTDFSVSTVKPE